MSQAAHVLVVGIDGVRYDTLLRVAAPASDGLVEEDLLRPVLVDSASPTISDPCWATIVTKVLPADHSITNNDFTGHRLDAHPKVVRLTDDPTTGRRHLRRGGVGSTGPAGGWWPSVRRRRLVQ